MKPGIANKAKIIQHLLSRPGLIDAHTHVGADAALFYTGSFPYALTAEDAMVRMDLTKVSYAVCFPFLYSAYYSLRDFVHGRVIAGKSELSPVPYQFENERLCREIYEAFPTIAGRLLPFAFFDPGRLPREQVDHLERLVQHYPIFGLKTATSYQQSAITELLGSGRCLLDFAAQHDLPVTVHTAVLPGDPWANVFEILRVVNERSDVRFCLAHTCRFDRRALEAAAALPNCFVDFSAFQIHCQLALQSHAAVAQVEHRFSADYAQHAAAMQAIAEAYPDTMIWGSDVPAHQWMSRFVDDQGREHWMHLTCDVCRETDELRRLPAPLQERIGQANTIRFLLGPNAARQRGTSAARNPAG